MSYDVDAARAYDAILASADERMSAHPKGGKCRDCANCVTGCFDAAYKSLADKLTAHYGICAESEPYLVELDEWHEWEECWCES